MSRFTVEWITEEPEFMALRAAWNALASKAQTRNVFLRHEWFDAVWQWRKQDGCALRIAAVYGDRALIAIWPMMLRETRHAGLPARTLEFLSVPDTQFSDILCEPSEAVVVHKTLSTALRDHAQEWQRLDLRHLSSDAIASGLQCSETERGAIRYRRVPWDTNPFIDLNEPWEAFYSRRSRSLKKANNLAANRLRRAGEIETQWVRGTESTASKVEVLLEEFIALSAKSWKMNTGLTLDNSRSGAFIRRLTYHALEQGWLSLWGLRLNEQLVAMEYQLVDDGHVYALRADFDQTLENISPGTYLSWQLLRQLFDSGFRRYWMGPGANAYKTRWTDRGETLSRVVAFSPTVKGYIHQFNERTLRPAVRKAFSVLQRAGTCRPHKLEADR